MLRMLILSLLLALPAGAAGAAEYGVLGGKVGDILAATVVRFPPFTGDPAEAGEAVFEAGKELQPRYCTDQQWFAHIPGQSGYDPQSRQWVIGGRCTEANE